MTITMTEEQFEMRLAWTMAAGEYSAMQGARNRVLEKSKEYFGKGNDEVARILRNMANELEEVQKNLGAKFHESKTNYERMFPNG